MTTIEHSQLGDFAFAHQVLFDGAENTIPGYLTRDDLFRSVLSRFQSKPIKILQVGAIETFHINFRINSGWSDLIFGEYIKTHGGELTVMDVDLDHLANSALAANTLGYDVNIFHGNATVNMDDTYDLYYLDGSPHPEETLEQFNQIKHTDSIVILDDYTVKGRAVTQDVSPVNIEVHHIANQLAVIDLRKTIA